MIGRAAVISYYARRRREKEYKEFGKDEKNVFFKKFYQDLKNEKRKKSRLQFNHYPIYIWVMSTIIFGLGLFLIIKVADDSLIPELERKNKQLSIFHFIWFSSPQPRSENGSNTCSAHSSCSQGFSSSLVQKWRKWNSIKSPDSSPSRRGECFQPKKMFQRGINDIANIAIVKRGINNFSNKTIHYKIVLEFNKGKNFEICETNSRMKIKKTYITLKVFLEQEIDIDGILIRNETGRIMEEGVSGQIVSSSKPESQAGISTSDLRLRDSSNLPAEPNRIQVSPFSLVLLLFCAYNVLMRICFQCRYPFLLCFSHPNSLSVNLTSLIA
eukprot:TRINITY_DN2841_c0_g1_i1.p1 TRINITY_DN2841_c0_g1~~TRINITY_DN2841_c0_g1_i1.p1  ORF type:complete len:327 (-),score=20.31 TRINITY_DN2841_c0_g1_i1:112-1092(-)